MVAPGTWRDAGAETRLGRKDAGKSVGLTTVKRSEFSPMDSLFLRGKT